MQSLKGWKAIRNAPKDRNVCVCVRDIFGIYELPFPCRHTRSAWVNSRTRHKLAVAPIGWKKWKNPKVFLSVVKVGHF
jgi:hypothetical protein